MRFFQALRPCVPDLGRFDGEGLKRGFASERFVGVTVSKSFTISGV